MKLRDSKDLHTKNEGELKTLLRETVASLSSARLEHAQQKLTNTRSLATLRTDIARIKTVLRTKAMNDGGKI